jgi:hypothetical protein
MQLVYIYIYSIQSSKKFNKCYKLHHCFGCSGLHNTKHWVCRSAQANLPLSPQPIELHLSCSVGKEIHVRFEFLSDLKYFEVLKLLKLKSCLALTRTTSSFSMLRFHLLDQPQSQTGLKQTKVSAHSTKQLCLTIPPFKWVLQRMMFLASIYFVLVYYDLKPPRKHV